MGVRVQGLGVMVQGLGVRGSGSGYRVRVQERKTQRASRSATALPLHHFDPYSRLYIFVLNYSYMYLCLIILMMCLIILICIRARWRAALHNGVGHTPDREVDVRRRVGLSSKVNLPHMINFRALCGASLVTFPSTSEGKPA